MDLPLEKSSNANASKQASALQHSVYTSASKHDDRILWSSFSKGFICGSPKNQESETAPLPSLQEKFYDKSFSILFSLPEACPCLRPSVESRLRDGNTLYERHTAPGTPPRRQVEPSPQPPSFDRSLLKRFLYSKIFKDPSPSSSHFSYPPKKYSIERFFAPALIQTPNSEEHLDTLSFGVIYSPITEESEPQVLDLIRTAEKRIVILWWSKAGFFNRATSLIPKLVEIQDLSLSHRPYFRESQRRRVLRYMNRVECWWRHRVKDPKRFLVPFSFNKPVAEQPKDLGCDHTRMFLWNSCRTGLAAGTVRLTELGQQLQHQLLRETRAGVCSGGTSCPMEALWWRLL